MKSKRRHKIAVWKFASCDGCQLSLLNLEDELLSIVKEVVVAYFPEGFRQVIKGPYDVSLIEGSITTPHDAERIHKIRRISKTVISVGACATAGGIQALRNFRDVNEFIQIVYAKPQYIDALGKSTPVCDHIKVDYELRGCPINKYQLLEMLSALLIGRKPLIPSYSVCIECKMQANVCVMVAHDTLCLGPVTQAGCGAICPAYHRGCYACFGPKESPNTQSLSSRVGDRFGIEATDLVRAFRGFNAYAEPFRKESEAHEV